MTAGRRHRLASGSRHGSARPAARPAARAVARENWGQRRAGPLAIALGAAFVIAVGLVAWLLSRPAAGEGTGGPGGEVPALVDSGRTLPGAANGTDRQAGHLEVAEPEPPPVEPPIAVGAGEEWLGRLPADWLMGWTATGRVLHADGTPLAGAEVLLLPDGRVVQLAKRLLGELVDVQGRTTTDADGRFRLETRCVRPHAEGLRGDYEPGDLVVCAEGCLDLPLKQDGFGPHGGDVGEVRMVAGARAFGRVVDEAGRPLSGVRVSLRINTDDEETPELADFSLESMPRWHREALTDDTGRFDFHDIWPGKVSVGMVSADRRDRTAPYGKVAAGGELDFGDVTLEQGVELRGQVVDGEGRPVERAWITCLGWKLDGTRLLRLYGQAQWNRTRSQGPDAWTDAEGRFRIGGRPLAPQALIAAAPGYAPTLVNEAWPGPGSSVVLRLEPWKTFELRVLGTDGGVPDGVAVRSVPTGSFVGPPVVAGPAGGFLLPDLGEDLRVEVTAPGYARTLADFAAPGPHELRLVASAGLQGRVTDPAGVPVERALVTLACAIEDSPDSGLALSMDTDADGTFRFADLVAGKWLLGVRAAGRPSVVNRELQLPLADGAREEVVLADPSRITGRVLGADGRPLQDVSGEWVRVTSPDGNREDTRWTQVEDGGRFVFENMLPGTWQVGWNEVSRVVGVEPGATAVVELRASPPVRLVGVVQDAGGQPVPSALVAWKAEPDAAAGVDSGDFESLYWGNAGTDRADETGRFDLSLPQAGDYVVAGIGPGGGRGPDVKVHVFAGTVPGQVTLVLATGVVEGLVVDAVTGTPVAKAEVGLGDSGVVTANAEGRFRLGYLPAGDFTLRVHADGYLRRTLEQQPLGEGEVRTDLRIELSRAAELEVRVRGPGGGYAESGIYVVAWRRDGKSWEAAGGAFRSGYVRNGVARIPNLEAVEACVAASMNWVNWKEGAPTDQDGRLLVPFGVVLRAGETTRTELPAP